MKKDYLEFITTSQTPPSHLKELVRRETILSFQGSIITKKFIAYQILGALISLAFCPQFGLSFFVDGHGFTHYLRMIGDWACALFCGSLFLSVGLIIAFFAMKGEELWWVLRHKKAWLILLPAVFWGILMFFNLTFNLPSEEPSYHIAWFGAAIVVQFLLLKIRTKNSFKF